MSTLLASSRASPKRAMSNPEMEVANGLHTCYTCPSKTARIDSHSKMRAWLASNSRLLARMPCLSPAVYKRVISTAEGERVISTVSGIEGIGALCLSSPIVPASTRPRALVQSARRIIFYISNPNRKRFISKSACKARHVLGYVTSQTKFMRDQRTESHYHRSHAIVSGVPLSLPERWLHAEKPQSFPSSIVANQCAPN
jgi:hypothetical protein